MFISEDNIWTDLYIYMLGRLLTDWPAVKKSYKKTFTKHPTVNN